MKPPRIAFLPVARIQFDTVLADELTRAARAQLSAAGFELVGPQNTITDLAAAQAAAAQISAAGIDLALVFQSTFADSTMVTALAETLDAPLFLWAVPETWSGGRLRLNSLCGINLAGHALRLRGKDYEYAYALPGDEAVLAKIRTHARAGMLRRRLKSARLGVIGERPNGMDTCDLDEPRLRETFGVTVEQFELQELFDRARAIPIAQVQAVRQQLETRLDNLAALQQDPLVGTLSIFSALQEITAERKLDGIAVRCWPEFFTQMGCAGCGAMSLLSDGFGGGTPIPCSCEADINGTLTQFLLQALAEAPVFGTDMVGADYEKDALALWHCGLAPLSMADPSAQPHGGNHSNRGVPLILDFPLKAGHVTIARISQAGGSLRMVLGEGEILDLPKPFSGTSGTLRLARPVQHFVDLLMREGLEHHVSLAYGDYLEELKVFAALINLPILNI